MDIKRSEFPLMERAILVGLCLEGQNPIEIIENLNELALLTKSTGVLPVETILQKRKRPDASSFIGKGKASEVLKVVKENSANVVIMDDDLSPAQSRNLENIFNCKVIDRTRVILDIFAKRARTAEAKTQVEMAQLSYLLPRLTRAWTHLSRQAGGIGTRGIGETQLETDRRRIRRRLGFLRDELKRLETTRTLQKKGREGQFKVAVVGYTNAGKSTLLNTLTEANVLVEDRLFATLDTTFRRLRISESCSVLFVDTVGFIRKFPPHLAASFRSTLDQVKEADLLLHIVDVSQPEFYEQFVTTKKILQDMELEEIESITVFNKCDLMEDDENARRRRMVDSKGIIISARNGTGIDALLKKVEECFESNFVDENIQIPYESLPFYYGIRQRFHIISEKHNDLGLSVTLKGRKEDLAQIKEFC